MVDWDTVGIECIDQSSLKIGMILALQYPPIPCQVIKYHRKKVGRRGYTHLLITAVSVWDGTEVEASFRATTLTVIKKKEKQYTLLDVVGDNGDCVVVNEVGCLFHNWKMKDEITIKSAKNLLKTGDEVFVIVASCFGVSYIVNPMLKPGGNSENKK
jgi:translation elongation factor P/translation initiation factor 5A